MAIAYYIPDQAKLLARYRSFASNSQQQRDSQSTMSSPTTTTTTTATATATRSNLPTGRATNQQEQQQQQQTTASRQHHFAFNIRNNQQFRANITIPLASEQGSMTMTGTEGENIGCWDMLAQIFCYALRFYNYTAAQPMPTVIQISFEISSVSDVNGVSQQTPAAEEPTAAAGSNEIDAKMTSKS